MMFGQDLLRTDQYHFFQHHYLQQKIYLRKVRSHQLVQPYLTSIRDYLSLSLIYFLPVSSVPGTIISVSFHLSHELDLSAEHTP